MLRLLIKPVFIAALMPASPWLWAQISDIQQVQLGQPQTKSQLSVSGMLIQSNQYIKENKIDSGIQLTLEILQKASKNGNHKCMDTAMQYLDYYLNYCGNDLLREKYILDRTISLLKGQPAYKVDLAIYYSKYAGYARQKNRFINALIYFDSALNSLPAKMDERAKKVKALIYGNRSNLWLNFGEIGKATEDIRASEQLTEQFQDKHRKIKILTTKGCLEYEHNRLDSAYSYLKQSYDLIRQYPDMRHTACECEHSTIFQLALILIKKQRTAEALQILQKGKNYVKLEKEKQASAGFPTKKRMYIPFLEAYAHFQNKEYHKIESLLLPLLDLQDNYLLSQDLLNVRELLAHYYFATQQYEKAYQHKLVYNDQYRNDDYITLRRDLVHFHYESKEATDLKAQKENIIRHDRELQQKARITLGVIGVTFVLSLSLIVLYRNHRNNNKLAATNITNAQQLRRINRLHSRLQGEEQERNRIARDLHDGISSQLLSLKLKVNALQAHRGELQREPELQNLIEQLEETTQDLKLSAYNLMPKILLNKGLVLSVATLCEQIDKNAGLSIHFQTNGQIPALQQEAELAVYRMIQELIQNALKHADASEIMVQIGYMRELLSITVEDNGCGMPAITTLPGNEGTGLSNIRRRVQLLQGQLDIRSKLNKHTTIYMEFPLQALI